VFGQNDHAPPVTTIPKDVRVNTHIHGQGGRGGEGGHGQEKAAAVRRDKWPYVCVWDSQTLELKVCACMVVCGSVLQRVAVGCSGLQCVLLCGTV